MPRIRATDVAFLELQNTVMCVDCELISYNNGSNCLSCGSVALLSLSRVLGGAVPAEDRARLVSNETIDRTVNEILERSYALAPQSTVSELTSRTIPDLLPQLEPAMRWTVERACSMTAADGAALALPYQGRLLCQANAGTTAPDLGVELNVSSGITGMCIRTRTAWKCDAGFSDARADRLRCRELGTQSVVAAPLMHLDKVWGVLEVLSSRPAAFDDGDVATVQLLASLMVTAIANKTRASKPAPALALTEG